MKRLILLLIVVSVWTSCKKESFVSEIDPPSSFPYQPEAQMGVRYNLSKQDAILLDSVLADCRCPIDAVCIWAGYAVVRFKFIENNDTTQFKLCTLPEFIYKSDTIRNEVVVNGYRIKLVDLLPYPKSTVVTKQSEYRAKLLITKQ